METTISLERNTGQDRLTVPFIAHVHYPKVFNLGSDFAIPVQAAYVGMQESYSVDICGFRSLTENRNAIAGQIERLLAGLTRSGRLPHYVFIARDAGTVYPVYTVENEVLAPTPNGPLFQHVELAVVRQRLADYLHEIKVLGAHGRTDKLHVRGISRATLQLKRPRFYLKKRVPNESDFWAPVFRSHDGAELYAYAASERHVAALTGDGQAVFTIVEHVAQALQKDNRLSNQHDLRPDRLFADTWHTIETNLLAPAAGDLVVNGVSLPVYTHRQTDTVLGLEARPDEDRYSLFLGDSIDDVSQRAKRDFIRRGIDSPNSKT